MSDLAESTAAAGWYGLIFSDGEGEVWVGAAYWDGQRWSSNVKLAYRRSPHPFATKEEAEEWASSQDD